MCIELYYKVMENVTLTSSGSRAPNVAWKSNQFALFFSV